jgi:hypothetical protein
MSEFVRNKILLRALVASIAPVTLYSVGYGFAALAGVATVPYFNMISWLAIASISAIYPINKIGCTMLIAPIDYIIWRKLRIDENKKFKGNFGPIEEDG